MKKTLLACLAVVAVLAVATPAFAITCTIDQRPAATLLVPFFQVTYDGNGNLDATGRDTIVTIANASAAPTRAPRVHNASNTGTSSEMCFWGVALE